ncbi:Piso0_004747 [Millerozyma farinosa CBS 7064]|uniref:Piso0_004747 protein n=1 Tax=Pichia sorbitophila (strain ATCC MYA-4447 / BCRC 22081 / CBS 7064 / NBRC 10061 / NRRL Y-12695) TaxID=559304 RepID=G8Y3A1_PICSO|nr:Piso0_004747 [Millerozyma farinosa CBS 7064]
MNAEWWKNRAVYQIWPASYKDSNGDGVGDIQGIISTLDYLKELGVGTIWLSPIFESPQDDMGYDVSDYQKIDKMYGSISDAEELIEECHKRDLKILLDLVINHTSSEHQWFKDSKKSKSNPRRNWYHWAGPIYGPDGQRCPPNNWRSNFGGSAWEWDEATQEYYLHIFAKSQPDLNWECEELRDVIYEDVMKYWLDKGVDGFRIDAITFYAKNPDYPYASVTDPNSAWQLASMHYSDQERNFDYIREMNEKVLSKYNCMTVGEFGPTRDTNVALRYVKQSEKRISMGFQFDTVNLGFGNPNRFETVPFKLAQFKETYSKWHKYVENNDGWDCEFLENHDLPRSVNRFGSDDPEFWEASCKALATLEATSSGTLFIYQGQEIGMTNMPKDWSIDEYRDIETLNYYNSVKQKSSNSHISNEKAMERIRQISRDHARTPVQWNSSKHAGFTSGRPWINVNKNYISINAEDQSNDEKSVLSFWKKLLLLRQKYLLLFIHGSFEHVDEKNTSIMSYIKHHENSKLFVALNFTKESRNFDTSHITKESKLLVSNVSSPTDNTLLPYEGRIYLL